MNRRLRIILFLGGIALLVAGFNGSRPLVITGVALILLTLLGGWRARRDR